MNNVLESEVKRVTRGVRHNYSIPDITDEEIKRLSNQMRACYRFGQKKVLKYIKPVHPRNIAFTWDAKPAEIVTGIEPLEDIRTLHRFGYYGFFKPSIAEVMAQIPPEIIDQVVAFEIIDQPTDAADLKGVREATDAGFHVAKTRLYKRKCTDVS